MDQRSKSVWNELVKESNGEAGRVVRISYIADQRLSVPNKQWACELIKRWDNEGYVNAIQNGAQAALTEKGVQRIHEISDRT